MAQNEKRDPVQENHDAAPPSRMERMKCEGEWPNLKWEGMLECMDYAAAIMFELGNYLMTSDKKVRVTIERDPEKGRFCVKREEPD